MSRVMSVFISIVCVSDESVFIVCMCQCDVSVHEFVCVVMYQCSSFV